MCGIVAVLSLETDSQTIAVQSLKKLEYRGYDSFGFVSESFKPSKHIGPVSEFKGDLESAQLTIAHTRWATHGAVTKENTHPHLSMGGGFALVHNGVILNYKDIKKDLLDEGYEFYSETDSEVIANLLEHKYLQSLSEGQDESEAFINSIESATSELEGEFALCIASSLCESSIAFVKRKSPIVFSYNEKKAIIASDDSAISDYFESAYEIEDGKVYLLKIEDNTIVTQDDYSLHNYAISKKEVEEDDSEFPDLMSKEMSEIANAIREVHKLKLGSIQFKLLYKCLAIIGCGSAYYAAKIGHYFRQEGHPKARTVSVTADELDELHSSNFYQGILCISQSGETFDTLEPARKALDRGQYVLSITNVEGSTLNKITTDSIYQNAGAERCVLSTKSIVSQCAVLNKLFIKGQNLLDFADIWEETFSIDFKRYLQLLAQSYVQVDNYFFIGRNIYHPVAQENALKLKEVTYCHAEAVASGFFKHGTLSLIDNRFVTFAHLPNPETSPDIHAFTEANISEIEARNGVVIRIGHTEECDVQLPCVSRSLDPLLHLGVGQYLAYYLALELGRNIDKPRSLAKSVTVR